MRIRTAAVAAVTLGLLGTATIPASAASERMQLLCESGSLEGRTFERTNGASWWDVEDGGVLTTHSIRVTHPDHGTVYEHTYGRKSAEAETCTATHFGYTWELELVPAGAR